MAQNFTDAVTQALQEAFTEAQNKRHSEVTENHLLHAFLKDEQGLFNTVLISLGANPSSLLDQVEQNLSKLPTLTGPQDHPPAAARSLQNGYQKPRASPKMERFLYQYRCFPPFLLEKWGRTFSSPGKENRNFSTINWKNRSKKYEAIATWIPRMPKRACKL